MPAKSSDEKSVKVAQMVRAYEASCAIQYPSDQERRFREALQKGLAEEFGLRALKNKEIGGAGDKPKEIDHRKGKF